MKKIFTLAIVLTVFSYLAGPWILTRAGEFLVTDDEPLESADAVVVLSTGVDYLPRLMQAATLYREGLVKIVVVNGNRKTDAHRQLEEQGYISPYRWFDGTVSVLAFLGVDKNDVITVNAENAYDTISEAQFVGQALLSRKLNRLIVTSSKFHTRRAISIWRYLYAEAFHLQVVGAEGDPFLVDGWWRSGRQIRQVLSEYGAWVYFWGKRFKSTG